MTPKQERTIVITGGSGGIGFQSALALAKLGHHLLITGRDQARGEAAVKAIREQANTPNISFVSGDLSSIAGVDSLAAKVLATVDTVDVLVNNAGYLGAKLLKSPDGLEMHFAVNVLAPWRLTRALLPALRGSQSARVVNVSGGDKPARIDPDNLQAEKGFRGLMTYTHAKSALEGMSMVLASELEPEGVALNVVFPGRASTAMTRSLSPASLPGPMKLMYPFFKLFFRDDGGKSAAKAAQSTIWAATSPELEGISGAYFDTHSRRQQLHPSAYEQATQARIRSVIERAEASHPPA